MAFTGCRRSTSPHVASFMMFITVFSRMARARCWNSGNLHEGQQER